MTADAAVLLGASTSKATATAPATVPHPSWGGPLTPSRCSGDSESSAPSPRLTATRYGAGTVSGSIERHVSLSEAYAAKLWSAITDAIVYSERSVDEEYTLIFDEQHLLRAGISPRECIRLIAVEAERDESFWQRTRCRGLHLKIAPAVRPAPRPVAPRTAPAVLTPSVAAMLTPRPSTAPGMSPPVGGGGSFGWRR